MMLHIMQVLHLHSNPNSLGSSLTVIFFDGEEAFGEWTKTDSLYGSRHLAERWEKEDKLSSISLFILLDLIGSKKPSFHSYWKETHNYFERLSTLEKEFETDLKGYTPGQHVYFKGPSRGLIDDDHAPFLKRGVPVLHSIATPFPSVWHNDEDNLDNLHWDTIYDLTKIWTVFVAELLSAQFTKISPVDIVL
eukprot:TRINITY_DN478_c0_g1_i2.p1 TRINITY_DN478_c0_g1~~TRINITY_DN478_c0_g1_i2.p1  ORF type:complete len:192 (-),score=34.82 TRINITY_DN478_c0_g1_i2:55-630(-)